MAVIKSWVWGARLLIKCCWWVPLFIGGLAAYTWALEHYPVHATVAFIIAIIIIAPLMAEALSPRRNRRNRS